MRTSHTAVDFNIRRIFIMKLFLLCGLLCLLAHNATTIEAMNASLEKTVLVPAITQEAVSCAICREECDRTDIDNEPKALACGHVFHAPCIGKWIHSSLPKADCPLCRAEVLDLALMRLLLRAAGREAPVALAQAVPAEIPLPSVHGASASPAPARAVAADIPVPFEPVVAPVVPAVPVPVDPRFSWILGADWLGS